MAVSQVLFRTGPHWRGEMCAFRGEKRRPRRLKSGIGAVNVRAKARTLLLKRVPLQKTSFPAACLVPAAREVCASEGKNVPSAAKAGDEERLTYGLKPVPFF
jgi:hypothetical protein